MARSTRMLPGLLLATLLAGCGGGGSHSVPPPPPDIPTLSAISPTNTTAGAASIALSVYGSNFAMDATVQWNGTTLSSSWVNATLMTATIPAANIASVGSAQVTVINPDAGGGTSGPQTFKILTVPSGATWVRAVAGIADPHEVVWDAAHGKLYVSVAAIDPLVPNSIIPIDPVAGVTGTPVPTGNGPNLLSISSDSSYLWVGLDGGNAVQRFLLPSLATDISFPLPLDWRGEPQQAVSLQAAAVSPNTVALVAGHWGYSPPGDGVYIYDNATQRPIFAPGSGPGGGVGVDWIQWGANDSTIYGNGIAAPIDTLAVTPSGVSVTNVTQALVDPSWTQYVSSTGLLYSWDGAYDPANSSLVGSFDLPAIPGTVCSADASLGRYYCVVSYSVGGSDIQAFELWVYDLYTHALVNRITFGESVGASPSPITGLPVFLVRWGNAGLALTTINDTLRGNGGVFLLDGAAVNPNAAPDSSSGTAAHPYAWLSALTPEQVPAGSGELTVTLTGTNFTPDSTVCYFCGYGQAQYLPTSFVSPQELTFTIPANELAAPGPIMINVFDAGSGLPSTNYLALTVASTSTGSTQVTALNLAGLAMAWDANSQLLYVGVADYDAAYPNSIVAIDGQSGAIVKTQAVASDPDLLSVSATGQYLYTAFATSTNMTQLPLPGLGSPLTWPLMNPALPTIYYAGDMRAAPVSDHTTAVTLFNPGSSPTSTGGVAIYDDAVVRPQYAPGWGSQSTPTFLDTIAWGSSDQILASAPDAVDLDGQAGPLYELQVSQSGAAFVAAGTMPFNTSDPIHSDFGTGLIYSDDGNVADPATQAIVGTYSASGLVATDSSLDRIFILGQTGEQTNTNNYTIQAFDEKAYTEVTGVKVNNLIGFPYAFVRWGTSGFAILTIFEGNGPPGMLYLVQDSSLAMNVHEAANQLSAPHERVQMRWKRISVTDVWRMIHARTELRLP